jgi:hypothetical protein
MAPEQLRREPLSSLTDLYGIAALMFKMISGRPPFNPTLADGLDAHLSQPIPRLSERIPHVPKTLDRLLTLALGSQEQRPASADLMRRTLERLLSELNSAPPPEDAFLPADEPLASASHNTHSTPPQAEQTAQKANTTQASASTTTPEARLKALLVEHLNTLTEEWARSISETPQFGRAQPHLIKVNAHYYLSLFTQVSEGRFSKAFSDLIEQLLAHLNPKSPELAPLLTGSLLTRCLNPLIASLSQGQQDELRGALYHLFYLAQRALIQAIVTRYPLDFEQKVREVFSRPLSELMGICSMRGLLRYTQPELRSVFGASSDVQLKQRDLFELLSGYQGLMSLQRDFRELGRGERQGFERCVILHHPHATGRAVTLKVSPHYLGPDPKGGVVVFFETLEERQIVAPISPDELSEDYAPQAPLWVETIGAEGMAPEALEQLFQGSLGEDEPTPIPGSFAPSHAPVRHEEPLLDVSLPVSAHPPAPEPQREPQHEPQTLDQTAPHQQISSSDMLYAATTPEYPQELDVSPDLAHKSRTPHYTSPTHEHATPTHEHVSPVQANVTHYTERGKQRSEITSVEMSAPPAPLEVVRSASASLNPQVVASISSVPSDQERLSSDAPSQAPATVHSSSPQRQQALHEAQRHRQRSNELRELSFGHRQPYESRQPRPSYPSSRPVPTPPPSQEGDHIYPPEAYANLKLNSTPAPAARSEDDSKPQKAHTDQSNQPQSEPPHPPTSDLQSPQDPSEDQMPHNATDELKGRGALSLAPASGHNTHSTRPSPIDTSQVPRRQHPEAPTDLNILPQPSYHPSSARLGEGEDVSFKRHALIVAALLVLVFSFRAELRLMMRSLSATSQDSSSQIKAQERFIRPEQGQPKAYTISKSATPTSNAPNDQGLSPHKTRLVFNTKANVYRVEQGIEGAPLCANTFVCDVPTHLELMVKAKGYYNRPLYQVEVSEHAGSEWGLKLIEMQ